MTKEERFEVALTRVRSGDSVRAIVRAYYKFSWREYKKQCTDEQRNRISSARSEYREAHRSKPKEKARPDRPRLIVYSHEDLVNAVTAYCKKNNSTIARFMNTAAIDLLHKHGIDVVEPE